MESNQKLPLTACLPSLALISAQESAGTSGIEPRGTENQTVFVKEIGEKKINHTFSVKGNLKLKPRFDYTGNSFINAFLRPDVFV